MGKQHLDERRVLREYAYKYLVNHSCQGILEDGSKCQEDNPACLEFDHIDPSKKKFSISQGIRSRVTISALKKEIKKCQVLCSNCHRKKTAIDQGWYKSLKQK